MLTGDTIAALSSPAPGPGVLRCVIRVSGPAAIPKASRRLPACRLAPGVHQTDLHFKDLVIPIVVYVFAGPRSYTGEDLVELHVPGSPWLVSALLADLLSEPGVRPAEPGEFTARAFFAGKLDLTAAEGVAATIAATDARQLRAARQLMAGELARRIAGLADRLANLLALLEAGIDFSDQDISFIASSDARDTMTALAAEIHALLASANRTLTREAGALPMILLVGKPNAGKSTLVNALLGRRRVIASPVAGTTRDIVWDVLPLEHGSVRLADSAGISQPRCEKGATVQDEIESEMLRRSLQAAEEADVLIVVRESSDNMPPPPLPRAPDLTVITKCDLGVMPSPDRLPRGSLPVSAQTGQNMDLLRGRLDQLAFGQESGQALALTSRHIIHLTAARAALIGAIETIEDHTELTAALLRQALDDLGAITGVISPDDVLGRVFSRFCIGK